MSEDRNDLLEILTLTREFAAAELRPHAEAWDRAGGLGEDTAAQLAELGFLGMLAPESAGGMALDRASMLAALEQLGWGEASAGLAVALHGQVVAVLAGYGTDADRERWLAALARGEVTGCAPTVLEVDTGVRAEPAGEGWRLAGELPWVGGARPAGLLLVPAAAGARRLLFLVPLDTAGVTMREPVPTLGLRPLGLRTVSFTDVVAAGGPLADGAEAAFAGEAALGVAAVAVGVAQAALDHAREYADVREQFGKKLRDFEGMGRKLADMAIRTAAARALLEQAARSGEPAQVSAAKVAAGEAAMDVTTQAVQVFGGYGYMRDYPVEKLMRDARAMSLLGGSDEGHRARITARLYGD